jgi:tetratricopeptide (TPR) repeat protein
VHLIDALLHHRVGRYQEASRLVDRARRVAQDLADPGAFADAELLDAVLSLDRGEHQRALEYTTRAVDAARHAGLDIMRVRRTALAHLIGGIAETRMGAADAARRRAGVLRALNDSGDPIQLSFQRALAGELALAEGRLDEAESGFRDAEYQVASSFAIYPALVTLVNNLPVRDGLARTAAARGDLAQALDLYRRLNSPDVTSKANAVFDPRFASNAADIADRLGDPAVARAERARFHAVWQGR